MRKILRYIGFGALAIAVLTLLGFVGSLRTSAHCEALEIEFKDASPLLVSENEVRMASELDGKVPVGMPMGLLDTRRIEESILEIAHIKEAAVYKTIDHKLIVEVTERKPIARLIDARGAHALLDEDGYLLPLSGNAVLRLPIISGHFRIAEQSMGRHFTSADSIQIMPLQNCFTYAQKLHSEPFWLAQLQHSFYTAEGEFVAYPLVGNHTIQMGTVDDLDEKFHRLQLFYQQGMDASRWNKYSIINLKFKDQIVCTKK